MNIAKRKRCQNTTSEQYEEYVKLMETDDIFRSGKLTPTISPNYILESWDNLTNKLNAIGTGPVLSSKEWAKVRNTFFITSSIHIYKLTAIL
jgi:hypothetical protein